MRSYEKLHRGGCLNQEENEFIRQGCVKSHQRASLCVLLLESPFTEIHQNLVVFILTTHSSIAVYLERAYPDHQYVLSWKSRRMLGSIVGQSVDPILLQILTNTCSSSTIGRENIEYMVREFLRPNAPAEFMAIWMMTVCVKGLSWNDTLILTEVMRDTGRVYDYRGLPELESRRLIRRYPTGALSEKTALILPSLLGAFSDEYMIASPFLVAKSLSFTGGTWDKLSSIPGFKFPEPGDETIATLKACRVAMSVTNSDVDPADREMYQLRSVTGTVESKELATASVASKQLAIPPHRLLLDLRYGEGAFFSEAQVKSLGDGVSKILDSAGVKCASTMTGTSQPNGMAIGNALEVCEAISLMSGNDPHTLWNSAALIEQKKLVLQFFAILMHQEFPSIPEMEWIERATSKFNKGEVLRWFHRILLNHHVSKDTADRVCQEPTTLLNTALPPRSIHGLRNGVITGINQRKLGEIVNWELRGGGNSYSVPLSTQGGILLKKRIGNTVKSGELLCHLYADREREEEELQKIEENIRDCFELGTRGS